jgi:inhibitor of cysteine peptidase
MNNLFRGLWLVVALACLVMGTLPVPVLAQGSGSADECMVIANSDITAYRTADTAAPSLAMPQGAGGYVLGETPDQAWIGFDPGFAQAGNLGLMHLRWVPASADITLQGNCNNLPPIQPPPVGICVLTFGGTVNAYTQPDVNSPVTTTLGENDYAQIVGRLSSGWYAWSNPGGQAGSIGTYNLRWIQDDYNVQLSGTCDQQTVFYPVPDYQGEVCTLLTGENGQIYTHPSQDAPATPLGGIVVQVLAKTSDQWYGFDPADYQDGTVGITRLRWIPAADVDQLRGTCDHVPTVDPSPVELTGDNNSQPVSLHTGDTLVVTLPGNPTTSYTWMQAPAEGSTNDPSVLQQQGDPQVVPSSDADGAGGDLVLTFQAVAAGKTTLALVYQDTQKINPTPQDTFTAEVTVTDQ